MIREGRHHPVEIRSGVRPSEKELASNDNTPGGRGDRANPGTPPTQAPQVLGMALATLDEPTRRRLNLPTDVRGVVVEGIVGEHHGLEGRTGRNTVKGCDAWLIEAADCVVEVLP